MCVHQVVGQTFVHGFDCEVVRGDDLKGFTYVKSKECSMWEFSSVCQIPLWSVVAWNHVVKMECKGE